MNLTIILQDGGLNPQVVNVLFIVGMILIFYFFMIRPQQQKQKKQKNFTEALKKGDKVVTIGGLHGTVNAIEDLTVIIEVDRGVKMRFDKSALSFEQTEQLSKVAR